MSLNSPNTRLTVLAVLLCSLSSQAETLPTITITARSDDIDGMAAQIKQGVRQQVQHALSHLSQPTEPARASTWDVLILDAQRAYWDATRDSADAQTEALLALRTLTAAQKGPPRRSPRRCQGV